MTKERHRELCLRLTTLDQVNAFGRYLGRAARPGDVICLDGDLGAGKTTLTQALALGLGVDESCYVTSPSFAILHEYPGPIPLYHMDLYRLGDSGEVIDLGFDEYFYGEGLCVIEWAERALDLMPEIRLHIQMTIEEDGARLCCCDLGQGDWAERLAGFST